MTHELLRNLGLSIYRAAVCLQDTGSSRIYWTGLSILHGSNRSRSFCMD